MEDNKPTTKELFILFAICILIFFGIMLYAANIQMKNQNSLEIILKTAGITAAFAVGAFSAYRIWILPFHDMDKLNGYWITKSFLFFLINGGIVVYYIKTQHSFLIDFTIFYVVGIIAFLYEIIINHTQNRSVIDVLKAKLNNVIEVKEFEKQTGKKYLDLVWASAIIGCCIVYLALQDAVIIAKEVFAYLM